MNLEHKKIKICHLVDELKIGGLEKTLKNIVLNLNKEKYHSQVWCLKNNGILAKDLEKEGVLVRTFNFEGGINLSCLIYLIRELKKENFKIMHAHGIFPSMWAVLAAILSRIPVRIVHCQNLYFDVGLRNRIKFKFLSFFTTEIIAVSQAVKKSLVEYLGIKPEIISVIYNSAAEIKILKEKRMLQQEFGIKEDDFIIGGISRLQEHKGQQYLLDAVFDLQSLIPNLKCLLVGNGPFRRDLEFKVEALGLKDKVIFTGLRKDVENLLSIMDIFVQASTLKEGLPLALAEAASVGLPLVATNVGGNPEIVMDGENGFIIPPKNSKILAEKIQHLAENPQGMKMMGENSKRLWQEKFNLGRMIKEIEGLYERYL